MSEAILDALMQLFALIIDIDENNKISDKEKEVIRSFLTQHLNRELADKYMLVFENYLDLFHHDQDSLDLAKKQKRKTLTKRKILAICEKINEELQQSQKLFVLIQLIEFISFGELVSEREKEFLQEVANAFKISEHEYQTIFWFIVGTVHDIERRENLLVINNNEKCQYKEIKHKVDPNFSGEIFFLGIESTKTYIFRYYGYSDLYFNGQNIISGRTYAFEHGSSIRSNTIKTIFYTDVVGQFSKISSDSKISVLAKDVSFWFKNTQNGIQKFNMNAKSGTLVAIMGGSGVGKSTLINILNGNLVPRRGEVFFNGINLNNPKERNNLKGIIGLVPQDDLLIEDLTVYQNLYYSAKLCLDNLKKEEIEEVVERTLTGLDLTDIKDLKVGNPLEKVISGGQRKRLNIALEIIREPTVLFVDEPTSGLSSLDAENVMNLLKEQTDNGKLVIVNIHQPSSYLYKMFDKVLILDKGGYQIYYGNPMEAIIYFKKMSHHANANEDQCPECGNVNTDQLLQIIDAKIVNEHGKLTNTRRISPKEWSTLFHTELKIEQESDDSKNMVPTNNFSIPNLIHQLWIFFRRDLLAKFANKQYVLISLLEAPLLALILGYFTKYIGGTNENPYQYVFYENENLPAYLFMSVVVALFLGLIGSSEEIIKDRRILKRESFLNLSRGSYLNLKILLLFIVSAIQTLSFAVVGNFILEIKGMTISYWLILFSTSCFANMLGLNISSAFDKVITVYVLIPFLLIPQLLLSGVIVKFDKLHRSFTKFDNVPVIGDMMTSRWAYEALSVHQFKDNEYQKMSFKSEMGKSQNWWYHLDLIPILENKTRECLSAIGKEENKEHFDENIYKIRKYMSLLSEHAGVDNRDFLDRFNSESFDSVSSVLTLDKLEDLKSYFRSEYLRYNNSVDSIVIDIETRYGKEYEHELIANYQNEKLKSSLLNEMSIDETVETRKSLIQKYQPIYMIPTSKIGRAHFYAPVKRLGDREIDTYWFNMAAIWFLSLILYLTLYKDILRKILNLRIR